MFNKLTVRLPDEPIYIPDENKWSVTDEFGAKCLIGEVVNRLAAYEDSGLSPEEVQEFAKAKAEGRLVVLPCKVGDAVYAITRCEDVIMHQDNDYLNGTGAVECPFDSTCDLEECDDENLRIFETECTGFWLEEGIKGIYLANLNMECYVSDFGKTVFLTREAAEKAIAEVKYGEAFL